MGQERHSDKVQRHTEIKGSHVDLWVGEKGHPRQRKQWGQGPCSGGTHEVFREEQGGQGG